jgi:hypothetical protein
MAPRLRAVGWFRRREETLNDRLLREAGYAPDGTSPGTVLPVPVESTAPSPTAGSIEPNEEALPVGSLELFRPRNWDVVTPVEAPTLEGNAYEFATVPDGSLIVDPSCEEELSPLADAVENHLRPPYRAIGVRQQGRLWLVSARGIDVMRMAIEGDEVELSSVGGELAFWIDGEPDEATRAPAELARYAKTRGRDYAVHATRLDEDLWEIEADPL